jgi:hypothetical protein
MTSISIWHKASSSPLDWTTQKPNRDSFLGYMKSRAGQSILGSLGIVLLYLRIQHLRFAEFTYRMSGEYEIMILSLDVIYL